MFYWSCFYWCNDIRQFIAEFVHGPPCCIKLFALILTEVILHCSWFPFLDARHLNRSFSFHHWQKDVKLICDLKFMSQVSSYLKVPLWVNIMETGRGARSARVTPVPVRGLCCMRPHPFPPSPQASLRLMPSSKGFHFVSYKTLFENIKREIRWCNAQVDIIYLF